MHAINASLRLLLSLAAMAHASPLRPRTNATGCSALSQGDFAWTVAHFQYNASYIFSTPAHQIDSGVVAFQLVNPAVPAATTSCRASSTQLQDYFYGNIVYTCSETADTSVSTTFTFSAPAQALTFNQSWVCADVDPTYPTTYKYYGAVNMSLDRYESNYYNGNWSLGQIYSSEFTERTTADFSVTPYAVSAVA